jgi:hypothetical protein
MPAIRPEEERAGVSACVRESWARRQALAHDCGVADAKHVARVSGATAGTMLHVDGEYLSTAIDLLCGFLLGAFRVSSTIWPAIFSTIWPIPRSLYRRYTEKPVA